MSDNDTRMVGTLTVAQLIAILDERLEPIKKDVAQLKKDMIEVKGFQKHEADSIEFDLGTALKKYLEHTYPRLSIRDFPLKALNDPYKRQDGKGRVQQQRITDLDAAYLLTPFDISINYSRLKSAKINNATIRKMKHNQYVDTAPYIFVLAEAKHYIDRQKVRLKLWQFDRIRNLFSLAKQIHNKAAVDMSKVHPAFITTLQHSQYLANIGDSLLFFGASYWEPSLRKELNSDINNYKDSVKIFTLSANSSKRIDAYKDICSIEAKWYATEHLPHNPDLSDTDILALNTIESALLYASIIQHSGRQYEVVESKSVERVSY